MCAVYRAVSGCSSFFVAQVSVHLCLASPVVGHVYRRSPLAAHLAGLYSEHSRPDTACVCPCSSAHLWRRRKEPTLVSPRPPQELGATVELNSNALAAFCQAAVLGLARRATKAKSLEYGQGRELKGELQCFCSEYSRVLAPSLDRLHA